MKALTLHQPWASLIALGVKTTETRSWTTKYRGPLAIHAAQTEKEMRRFCHGARRMVHQPSIHIENTLDSRCGWSGFTYNDTWGTLPLGAIVATCQLVDVVPTPQPERCDYGGFVSWSQFGKPGWTFAGNGDCFIDSGQRPYGDFTPGRFAWLLGDIERIDPVPAKGKQGLWEWTPERVPVRA